MAVLNCRSSGNQLVEKFRGEKANFSTDITKLIKQPGPECPDTFISGSIFSMIKVELERHGIDTQNFIVRSGIDTKADARHWTDMVAYLPSIPRFPITVDLYNISPYDVVALRDIWVSLSDKPRYSELDLQSDLFQHNRGLFAWMKQNQLLGSVFVYQNLGGFRSRISSIPEKTIHIPLLDLRQYADRGRPENHFILTPYHTETPERRKNFATMVAKYLISVSGHENMALLSH